MQYLGGKSRIARAIAAEITARAPGRRIYVEPFLGAGSVALALAGRFERMIAADASLDLVLLWQAAQAGWVPPAELSEDEYAALRHAEPSALRGFAGFPCSFGGKWFGGYARDPKGGRNFAASASRSVSARGEALRNALILHADYRDVASAIVEIYDPHDVVLYADPPYAGTTAYGNVEAFDSARFWDEMRALDDVGVAVFVSEYAAPGDFRPVWTGSPMTTLRRSNTDERGDARRVGESLYMREIVTRRVESGA